MPALTFTMGSIGGQISAGNAPAWSGFSQNLPNYMKDPAFAAGYKLSPQPSLMPSPSPTNVGGGMIFNADGTVSKKGVGTSMPLSAAGITGTGSDLATPGKQTIG